MVSNLENTISSFLGISELLGSIPKKLGLEPIRSKPVVSPYFYLQPFENGNSLPFSSQYRRTIIQVVGSGNQPSSQRIDSQSIESGIVRHLKTAAVNAKSNCTWLHLLLRLPFNAVILASQKRPWLPCLLRW